MATTTSASNYLEDKLLDHVFRCGTYSPPENVIEELVLMIVRGGIALSQQEDSPSSNGCLGGAVATKVSWIVMVAPWHLTQVGCRA